jgi:hypothetical protein
MTILLNNVRTQHFSYIELQGLAWYCALNMNNTALGPCGQIRVQSQTGIVGKCVSIFWPSSGVVGAITVGLKASDGVVHDLPLFSVREPTTSELTAFWLKSGSAC